MKKQLLTPFLLSVTTAVFAQCGDLLLNLPFTGNSTDQSVYAHTTTPTSIGLSTGFNGDANAAYQFSSSSDLQVANNAAFQQMEQGFTIAAWVNPSSLNAYNCIFSKITNSHRDFVLRIHNDGKVQLHFGNSNNGSTLVFCTTDNSVVSLNTWTHVAATWDDSFARIYINGNLVKEQDLSTAQLDIQTGVIHIGNLTGAGAEPFNGRMDQVKIYSAPLSATELSCLYYEENALINDGLVAYYPFNGNFVDVTDNANNGSAAGSTIGLAQDLNGNADKAAGFNGGRITVANSPSFANMNTAFSISAWINPSDITGNKVIFSKFQNNTSFREIVLRLEGGKLAAHFDNGTGLRFCNTAAAVVAANQWQLVTLTWDGNFMNSYVNDSLVKSVDFTADAGTQIATGEIIIGAITASGGEDFAGKIDELRVFERALNTCDLYQLLKLGNGLLVQDNIVLCDNASETLSASENCAYLWEGGSTSQDYLVNGNILGAGSHTLSITAHDLFNNEYIDSIVVDVQLCTGVDEVTETQNAELAVYPNPASDNVTIETATPGYFTLTNVLGEQLMNIQIQNKQTLSMEQFTPGIYFITELNSGKTLRLLIE